MMKPTAMLALALAATAPVLPAVAQTSPTQTPAPQAQGLQPAQAPQSTTGAETSGTQAPHRRREHGNSAQAPQKTLVQHVDDRIAMMHRRLAITAQQEPAWNTFARIMRDNATAAEQAYRDRATRLEGMTALDNLRAFTQLEQARAQGLQNLTNAFEPLYASFSDEQKKTADAIFRRDNERMAQRHRGASHTAPAAKTEDQK